jgi:hypothetical protein
MQSIFSLIFIIHFQQATRISGQFLFTCYSLNMSPASASSAGLLNVIYPKLLVSDSTTTSEVLIKDQQSADFARPRLSMYAVRHQTSYVTSKLTGISKLRFQNFVVVNDLKLVSSTGNFNYKHINKNICHCSDSVSRDDHV